MLLERDDSFMSEFEDACSAWVDSVGSSPSDGADSDVGSPFCQGKDSSSGSMWFIDSCVITLIITDSLIILIV